MCADNDFGLASEAAVLPVGKETQVSALAGHVLRKKSEGTHAVESEAGVRVRLVPRASGVGTAFWVITLPAPILRLRELMRGLGT